MSGLSLRTVQRLEAGHRVSYASLRALAIAFKTEADVLEKEFYAVQQSARASAVRLTAIVPIAGCYLLAVTVRMFDRYRLWPGSENAPLETPRTWRSTAAEYTLFIVVGALGILVAARLIG